MRVEVESEVSSTEKPTNQREGTMELELIETEVLITELLRRYDHAVVVGLLVQSEARGMTVVRHWGGNLHTCMGLCIDTANVLSWQLRH